MRIRSCLENHSLLVKLSGGSSSDCHTVLLIQESLVFSSILLEKLLLFSQELLKGRKVPLLFSLLVKDQVTLLVLNHKLLLVRGRAAAIFPFNYVALVLRILYAYLRPIDVNILFFLSQLLTVIVLRHSIFMLLFFFL